MNKTVIWCDVYSCARNVAGNCTRLEIDLRASNASASANQLACISYKEFVKEGK